VLFVFVRNSWESFFWLHGKRLCVRRIRPRTPPISGSNHPNVAKSAVTENDPPFLPFSIATAKRTARGTSNLLYGIVTFTSVISYHSCFTLSPDLRNVRPVNSSESIRETDKARLSQMRCSKRRSRNHKHFLHFHGSAVPSRKLETNYNRIKYNEIFIWRDVFFKEFSFQIRILRLTRSRRHTDDNVTYARNISLSLFDERWRPAERSKPSRGLTSLGWRRSLLFSVVASFDEQLFPSRCGQIAQKLGFPFSWYRKERERESSLFGFGPPWHG